jgi:CheY-like chemotaxis protein
MGSIHDLARSGLTFREENAVHRGIAVLVVEDEALVKMDVSDSLSDQGFEVYEARDAGEAMAVLESGIPIRVLFTDVDMPKKWMGWLFQRR